MANLRVLFLLGLVVPALISPGLARPTYDHVQERDTIPRLDGSELALPLSSVETASNTIYDGQKKQQTAHLFRRTYSGGGGGGDGGGGDDEEQQRLRRAFEQRREELRRQAREAQQLARARDPDELERLRQRAREEQERRRRQREASEAARLELLRWRAREAERLELLRQQHREYLRMYARDRTRLAELSSEEAAELERLRRQHNEYVRMQRSNQPRPNEGSSRRRRSSETTRLSKGEYRRYADCEALLKRRPSHSLTPEEHQVCIQFARNPAATVEDIFQQLAIANEARDAQQRPPSTTEEEEDPNQNNSILTNVSQMANKAVDSIKQAAPSWLNNLGNVVQKQSSAPAIKPPNGIPAPPALPAIKVP